MSEKTLSNYSKQIKRFIGDYFKDNPDSKVNLRIYLDSSLSIDGNYFGNCPLILIAGSMFRIFIDKTNFDNFMDERSNVDVFLNNERIKLE